MKYLNAKIKNAHKQYSTSEQNIQMLFGTKLIEEKRMSSFDDGRSVNMLLGSGTVNSLWQLSRQGVHLYGKQFIRESILILATHNLFLQ